MRNDTRRRAAVAVGTVDDGINASGIFRSGRGGDRAMGAAELPLGTPTLRRSLCVEVMRLAGRVAVVERVVGSRKDAKTQRAEVGGAL